ncbi:hypothetical protein [Curtobacterium flaccumfaciens]
MHDDRVGHTVPRQVDGCRHVVLVGVRVDDGVGGLHDPAFDP